MEDKLVRFRALDRAPEHVSLRLYTKTFRIPDYRSKAIAQKKEENAKKNKLIMSKEELAASIDNIVNHVPS